MQAFKSVVYLLSIGYKAIGLKRAQIIKELKT